MGPASVRHLVVAPTLAAGQIGQRVALAATAGNAGTEHGTAPGGDRAAYDHVQVSAPGGGGPGGGPREVYNLSGEL